MKIKLLYIFSLFISLQASGASLEEKRKRVDFLEKLSLNIPLINIDAYKKDLEYEAKNISLEQRTKNETNKLAEKIKSQVLAAYESALNGKTREEAFEEVRLAIENDLELINPSFQSEIKSLAMSVLNSTHYGSLEENIELNSVASSFFESVRERHEFLNEEIQVSEYENNSPSTTEFKTKEELVKSLVKDKAGYDWGSSSTTTVLKSAGIAKQESKISFQVQVQFLGATLEAGPTITFKREYKTSVTVTAEGLRPVLLPNGNFDFNKRDREGKIIFQNGKASKRIVSFYCDVGLEFQTDYSGEGKFSVIGIGGSSSVSSAYSNSVNLASRVIFVPEYVANESVTYQSLQQICHHDFLKAKISNNLTVTDSLNILMKNVVGQLRFSHPKTKCMMDKDCFLWFKYDLLGLLRVGNYPRCVEEQRQKYFSCELRGLTGQNCSVYDQKGKLLSDGQFEFVCDIGLKCVKVQEEGFFRNWKIYQYAKGQCQVSNPRTYKAP